MVYDYGSLRGKIVEKCGTIEKFSSEIGITSVSVGRKLSNKSEWKKDEIVNSCNVLSLDFSQIPQYFFRITV